MRSLSTGENHKLTGHFQRIFEIFPQNRTATLRNCGIVDGLTPDRCLFPAM